MCKVKQIGCLQHTVSSFGDKSEIGINSYTIQWYHRNVNEQSVKRIKNDYLFVLFNDREIEKAGTTAAVPANDLNYTSERKAAMACFASGVISSRCISAANSPTMSGL